jgi:hypothetical protein
VLAAAYKWRWDGSETALREAKSAIRGAGPSTGPIFRSRTPDMFRQEHAAWVTATELVRAVGRQAAQRAAPARKGRRCGQPVQPREISFTAARRAAITTTRNGAATASLPGLITGSRYHDTLHDLGRRRFTIDRDRHRDHKTKWPARHSPPPGARSPPARRPPSSPSAARSPPEARRIPPPAPPAPPDARGTGRRPGATSGLQPCPANTITVSS